MKRIAVLIIALLTVFVAPSSANAADPVPEITASATSVAVGQPITFTITDVGLTPSGKITYRNPRTYANINVANFYGHTGLVFTYVPSPGEVGRIEVFTATYSIPAYGHIVRLSSSSVAFTVTPALVA